MVKKISLVLVIVLLLGTLLTLVGCGGEDYTFNALPGDTTGEVTSNGGIAVIKGSYLYFVNGYLPYSKTLSNEYGAVKEGAIMRMALADLDAYYQANEEDRAAILSAKAVVVAPKHIHYENVTDKSINGIFIFGDRMYYYSSNVTTDKNGKIQSQWPVLLSCKLDGTDTVLHYTFKSFDISSNTDTEFRACLSEKGDSVYAMYVEDNTLNCLEVYNKDSGALETPVVANTVKDMNNYLFDQENCRVYYTNEDKSVLYCYTLGAESEAIHVSPADYLNNVTFTPNFIADGKLYYQVEGVVLGSNKSVYSASFENGEAKTELVFGPVSTLPSSYLACDGYYIYPDANSTKVAIYKVAGDSAQTIKRTSTLSGIQLDKIEDGYVYFYATNVLYRIELAKIDWTSERAITKEGTVVEENTVDKAQGIITDVNKAIWAKYDICGNYVFIISNTSVSANTYDGELTYNAIKVAHKDSFTAEKEAEKQLNLSIFVEIPKEEEDEE